MQSSIGKSIDYLFGKLLIFLIGKTSIILLGMVTNEIFPLIAFVLERADRGS